MSSGSSASSPASDGTPRALAPLAPSSANGLTLLQPNDPQSRSLLTHRIWTIPPRPKPGRKAATDTPPTKRKAQNRAAQRAFRERRAAKVGELEEQMKEMEEEDEREQTELRGQISRLEVEVKDYEQLVMDYSERMRVVEQELVHERDMRVALQRELAGVRGERLPVDVVPLATRRKPYDISPTTSHVPVQAVLLEDIPLGCGNCTMNTRCECFERAINTADVPTESSDTLSKRPHSPFPREHNKRLCHNQSHNVQPEEEIEIDFTTRPPQLSSTSLQTPASNFEGCGFCQDGTTCLCAELAEDARDSSSGGSNLARLLSDSDDASKYTASTKLPPAASYPYSLPNEDITNPCKNGPGTCSQCQSNPTSTLFCKSLAATRCDASAGTLDGNSAPTSFGSSAPCGNPNGCCRTQGPQQAPAYLHPEAYPNARPLTPPSTQSVTGPTLSCADAFTTLSRHPAFDRASDGLGAWLPKLVTVPKGMEGRTAFEIEAGSVMGVLKFFDRQYGRGI